MSAIRSPETAQCDKFVWSAGDEWVRFAVRLKNLIQLSVQVGAVSDNAHQLPPHRWWGESATLRRENGYQSFDKLRTRVQGVKGDKLLAESGDA